MSTNTELKAKGSNKYCCCLYRLNYVSPQEHPYIILDGKDIVTFGRWECDVILSESKAVSKKHAVMTKCINGQWAIKDFKSSNGVYVNNVRIPADEDVLVHDRQVIEFGRNMQNTQATYYRFQFYSRANLVLNDDVTPEANIKALVGHRPRVTTTLGTSPSTLWRDKIRQREKWLEQEMAMKLAEQEKKVAEHETKLAEKEEIMANEIEAVKRKLESTIKEQKEKEMELNSVKDEKDKLLDATRIDFKRKLVELETVHAAKETQLTSLLLEQSMEQAQIRAEQERERELLHKQLMEQFSNRESTIKQSMEKELEQLRRTLSTEKQKMEVAIREKNSDEQGLRETIVELRERQRDVSAQLDAAQKEVHSFEGLQQQVRSEAKTEVVTSMEDLVDTELVCAICSELFIKATSLSCSHSFCEYCIEKWLLQKKECPNCRQTVKSHVRSIVLDNYIDRLVQLFSEDTQSNRKLALAEREGERKVWEDQRKAKRDKRLQAPVGHAVPAATPAPRVVIDLTQNEVRNQSRQNEVRAQSRPNEARNQSRQNEVRDQSRQGPDLNYGGRAYNQNHYHQPHVNYGHRTYHSNHTTNQALPNLLAQAQAAISQQPYQTYRGHGTHYYNQGGTYFQNGNYN